MQVKPGIKTTEFWVTAFVNVVAAAVAILAARGLVSSQEGELWVELARAMAMVVAPIVMGQVTKSYAQSRATVKAVQEPRMLVTLEERDRA